MNEINGNIQYCMHACGFIYELMFTNSLESLQYWYKQGIKMFEIDIDDAGNGNYVACHDFVKATLEKMEIENIPEECTYDWFRKQKLYKRTTEGLTPMTLEDIFQIMCDNQDIIIMIDPKIYSYEGCGMLLRKIGYYLEYFGIDGKRIIFETYNEDMINATSKHKGLVRYQHCIDDEMQMGSSEEIRKWSLDKTIDFLWKNDICIISYPWKLAVHNLERLKRLKDEGFFIFSKTRNDILAGMLSRAGVDVNIVDYLVTEKQRIELREYQNRYYKQYGGLVNTIFGHIY